MDREYKLGKAYRYFTDNLVREIFYKDIENTNLCFLKCRVVHSQSMRSTAYNVWSVITKDVDDETPGGEVLSAYCSCTAGLGGMCNHITGLLFRLENAVIRGLTKPSKTSKLCNWNVPKGSSIGLNFCPVTELNFQKNHYIKLSDRNLKEEAESYQKFEGSLHENQRNELRNFDSIRTRLFKTIKEEIPKSRLTEILENRPLNREKTTQQVDLPLPLFDVRNNFNFDEQITITENVKNFIKTIQIDEDQVKCLQDATAQQSDCNDWTLQRRGRITASNFYRVFTKVKTLEKDPETDCSSLIKTLLGESKIPETKSLKHGRSMEPRAKRKYFHEVKRKHKNLNLEETGLVLLKDFPYIGASPDGLISCLCCGRGVLEIKCPFSIIDQAPSKENLSYLEEIKDLDGTSNTHLKVNTPYYFQIQGQMAATKTLYCHFFVFTAHGYFFEEIKFNKEVWNEALTRLNWFWINHLAPKILIKLKDPNMDDELDKEMIDLFIEPNFINTITRPAIATRLPSSATETRPATSIRLPSPETIRLPSSVTITRPASSTTITRQTTSTTVTTPTTSESVKTQRIPSRKRKIDTKIFDTGNCKVCGERLKSKPAKFEEESICCDSCNLWSHLPCVGICDESKIPNKKIKWFCEYCKN